MKILAYGPITLCQIDGETMETTTGFIFLSSKITVDSDCDHQKIKRCLLFWRKPMTKLDSILKSRHYFANKGPCSQSFGFPMVMYGCENWTIKKAEHWSIDIFELWYWKRLLRVPMDCKEMKPVNSKGNQSWIFIGRKDAEAPILWPPDAKSLPIRKAPDAGKDWRQEEKLMTEWDSWMASPARWTWVWASSGRRWRTGKPGVLQSTGLQMVGHDWSTEQPQYTTVYLIYYHIKIKSK